jgi:beta-alanine degradation protein BauB
MDSDPTVSNPGLYRTLFENDRVRVLEYKDEPGDKTTPHRHPDSVMFTLSNFRRRLYAGGGQVDVELEAGATRWLGSQEHAGENIGDTDTHVIFVELKEPGRAEPTEGGETIGPSAV